MANAKVIFSRGGIEEEGITTTRRALRFFLVGVIKQCRDSLRESNLVSRSETRLSERRMVCLHPSLRAILLTMGEPVGRKTLSKTHQSPTEPTILLTHFGAFTDIGVHQDALIHISQLSDEFVSDPNEIVAVGDVVRVKVLEIDIPRKRISLTRQF